MITCHDNLTDASVERKVCNSQNNDLRFTLYPIGLAISSIFLVATLVASYLLPASHHVLHWRCQTNHVACLLLGDLLLCITHISGDCMSKTPCILIGEFISVRYNIFFFEHPNLSLVNRFYYRSQTVYINIVIGRRRIDRESL